MPEINYMEKIMRYIYTHGKLWVGLNQYGTSGVVEAAG
jgi:hypothetical protein